MLTSIVRWSAWSVWSVWSFSRSSWSVGWFPSTYSSLLRWTNNWPLRCAISTGDLAGWSSIPTGDLVRRSSIPTGDLVRRSSIPTRDLVRRSSIPTGDLARRSSIPTGDLARRSLTLGYSVTSGDLRCSIGYRKSQDSYAYQAEPLKYRTLNTRCPFQINIFITNKYKFLYIFKSSFIFRKLYLYANYSMNKFSKYAETD